MSSAHLSPVCLAFFQSLPAYLISPGLVSLEIPLGTGGRPLAEFDDKISAGKGLVPRMGAGHVDVNQRRGRPPCSKAGYPPEKKISSKSRKILDFREDRGIARHNLR
jgi:hypothetical protein